MNLMKKWNKGLDDVVVGNTYLVSFALLKVIINDPSICRRGGGGSCGEKGSCQTQHSSSSSFTAAWFFGIRNFSLLGSDHRQLVTSRANRGSNRRKWRKLGIKLRWGGARDSIVACQNAGVHGWHWCKKWDFCFFFEVAKINDWGYLIKEWCGKEEMMNWIKDCGWRVDKVRLPHSYWQEEMMNRWKRLWLECG